MNVEETRWRLKTGNYTGLWPGADTAKDAVEIPSVKPQIEKIRLISGGSRPIPMVMEAPAPAGEYLGNIPEPEKKGVSLVLVAVGIFVVFILLGGLRR